MLGTATITGIFYGTDGAPVPDADVYIVPKQKYVASVSGAAWVPRPVTGRTDATGAIGTLDGETFTAGIALGQGQHEISVRKGDASHNGVLTIDEVMTAAGTGALANALQAPIGTTGTIKGDAGWSPVLAVVSDGARRVLQVTDWTGGAGAKPATGSYLGVGGLVETVAEAVDMRGAQGDPGPDGPMGSSGWTPVFAVVLDGERRVLQVVDWTGGEGDKPTTGQYVGPSGLVATAAEAVDVRGAQGPTGATGSDGTSATITNFTEPAAYDAYVPGPTELKVLHD